MGTDLLGFSIIQSKIKLLFGQPQTYMETFATGFLPSFNFFLVKAMRKDVGNYPHFFDYNLKW